MSKVWLLKRINIFDSLGQEGMKRLAEVAREETFLRGSFVFRENDEGECIYLLKSGKIKLSRFSRSGRELILGVMRAGEVFGEEVIAGKEKRTTFAVALEDSLLCAVPTGEFIRLLSTFPELAVRFAGVLTTRLKTAHRRMEDFLFRNVRQRLALFLTETAEREGERKGEKVLLPAGLTHQQIAGNIGSTRETVTSLLNELKAKGFLELQERRLVITDSRGLAETAEG